MSAVRRCIYFFAGVSKTGPEWWVEGGARYYALLDGYWLRPLGEFVLGYPELMRFLTGSTLALDALEP